MILTTDPAVIAVTVQQLKELGKIDLSLDRLVPIARAGHLDMGDAAPHFVPGADDIAGHPAVTRTIYPGRADHPQHDLVKQQMSGFGTVLSFEISGGQAGAFRFMNALNIILISNNLGDAKSIVTHPATTTHQRLSQDQRDVLGVTDGLIRLSVGLEDVGDLSRDLLAALDAA